MKNTATFLFLARTYATKKQEKIARNSWIGIYTGTLILINMILYIANIKISQMKILPIFLFLLSVCIIFFNKYFYKESILRKRQLEYLKKYIDDGNLAQYKDFVDAEHRDDRDSINAEEYRNATAAIEMIENEQLLADSYNEQ